MTRGHPDAENKKSALQDEAMFQDLVRENTVEDLDI